MIHQAITYNRQPTITSRTNIRRTTRQIRKYILTCGHLYFRNSFVYFLSQLLTVLQFLYSSKNLKYYRTYSLAILGCSKSIAARKLAVSRTKEGFGKSRATLTQAAEGKGVAFHTTISRHLGFPRPSEGNILSFPMRMKPCPNIDTSMCPHSNGHPLVILFTSSYSEIEKNCIALEGRQYL